MDRLFKVRVPVAVAIQVAVGRIVGIQTDRYSPIIRHPVVIRVNRRRSRREIGIAADIVGRVDNATAAAVYFRHNPLVDSVPQRKGCSGAVQDLLKRLFGSRRGDGMCVKRGG